MANTTCELGGELLAAVLADETFLPAPLASLEEAGLPVSLVESLIIKYLGVVGTASGRGIAKHVALPFGILENCYQTLRGRQIVTHTGSAPINDFCYVLTEQGRERAQIAMSACAYVGPAPVLLEEYVVSVEAQTIRAEAPKREQLARAFSDISVNSSLFESLGPAVNSGAGLFLYGAPGNGKSTLARRITQCFGQHIWVPHALLEDGQLIKVYDTAYHQAVDEKGSGILCSHEFDARWVRVRRPTVMVGGELTLDNLEIRHDPTSNVSEAPLQMKSNCGCLVIDDFGRQRLEPAELLNRWIVPLESGHDFLTLSTGKKIQVPFEQLIIFSTNLEPSDLVDDAFLRRIPYKIEIGDADEAEFRQLFKLYAKRFGCEYVEEAVDHLIAKHYRVLERPMRRCQPRDLLSQIQHYCAYNDLPLEMRAEYFDRVAKSYFTVVVGT